MIKHFISVEIVDHRLVSMPHMLSVTGKPSVRPVASRAIEPPRGIAIAAGLSVMLWAMLIAAVAAPSTGDAGARTDVAACTSRTGGAACETPPRG